MQTFISDISNKEFPIANKVSGKTIRQYVLDEIHKTYPDFSGKNAMSTSELNDFRHQYIQSTLFKEIGTLANFQDKALKSLSTNKNILKKIASEHNETLTYGEKLADKVATFGGSWKFIIIFGGFITIWIAINIVMLAVKAFDPYPFILLNLILSCLAALQAPVIMMSQNRQESKDRERAQNDYKVNLKSEIEIRMLHEKIDHFIINQQEKLMEVQQVQIDIMNDIMQRLEQPHN